jgi:hypothetical protein
MNIPDLLQELKQVILTAGANDDVHLLINYRNDLSDLTNQEKGSLIKHSIDLNLFEFDNLDTLRIPNSATHEQRSHLQELQSKTKILTKLFTSQSPLSTTNLNDTLYQAFTTSNPLERLTLINQLTDELLSDAIQAIPNPQTKNQAKKLQKSDLQEAKAFAYALTTHSESAKAEFVELYLMNKPDPIPADEVMKFFNKYSHSHPYCLAGKSPQHLAIIKGGGKESDALIKLDDGGYMCLLATADESATIEKDSLIRHPLATSAYSLLLPTKAESGFKAEQEMCEHLASVTATNLPDYAPQTNKGFSLSREKANFYQKNIFAILSTHPHLCINIITNNEPTPSKDTLKDSFNSDANLTLNTLTNLPTKSLFFGHLSSTAHSKDSVILPNTNQITERFVFYILAHLNNLYNDDQNKYQKIDFSDISTKDLAIHLLEFKTASAYDAMEHLDLEQAQSYIENPQLILEDIPKHPITSNTSFPLNSQTSLNVASSVIARLINDSPQPNPALIALCTDKKIVTTKDTKDFLSSPKDDIIKQQASTISSQAKEALELASRIEQLEKQVSQQSPQKK